MPPETDYTRKFRKELMAGLSSLVLLAVLARAGREMYGYEIAKAVKAEGEGRSRGASAGPDRSHPA